ncbi:MAG: hypothetical protein WAL56_24710 [Candidatus Sulfotelmatobacter sp.]
MELVPFPKSLYRSGEALSHPEARAVEFSIKKQQVPRLAVAGAPGGARNDNIELVPQAYVRVDVGGDHPSTSPGTGSAGNERIP